MPVQTRNQNTRGNSPHNNDRVGFQHLSSSTTGTTDPWTVAQLHKPNNVSNDLCYDNSSPQYFSGDTEARIPKGDFWTRRRLGNIVAILILAFCRGGLEVLQYVVVSVVTRCVQGWLVERGNRQGWDDNEFRLINTARHILIILNILDFCLAACRDPPKFILEIKAMFAGTGAKPKRGD